MYSAARVKENTAPRKRIGLKKICMCVVQYDTRSVISVEDKVLLESERSRVYVMEQ